MKNWKVYGMITAAGLISASAHATGVTLYGVLDGGIQYQSVKINGIGRYETKGMHSDGRAGNRWGLKGTESLGNGIEALFVLEAGFNLTNGRAQDAARTAFNRQSYIGLSSEKWGKVTLGRQYNAGFFYASAIGPFGNSFSMASRLATFSTATVRYDNLVLYETPDIKGFQAKIGYSRETGIGNGTSRKITDSVTGVSGNDATNVLTMGARYSNGPFKLVATFDRLGKVPARPSSNDGTGSIKSWLLGASYDFNVVRIDAVYGQDIDGRIAASSANVANLGSVNPVPSALYVDGFKARNVELGVSAPALAGRVLASWQISDSNLTGKTVGDNGVGNQQSYSLGYTYDFSKRTNFYAIATYMKNPVYIQGATSREYRIGLNHMF